MTDLQVQERVAGENGQNHRDLASPTPATADAPARPATRTSAPRTRSGLPVIRLIELAIIGVLAFLALDFVFHAIGALNVGFAGVIFTVGSFLASPFVGIFTTTPASQGNLLVWTDILAMGVYAAAALVLAIATAKIAGSLVRRPV
jgi:hypothetical protein